jgi:hypothetical protein
VNQLSHPYKTGKILYYIILYYIILYYIIWYKTGTQKIWSKLLYECDFSLLRSCPNIWTLTTLPKVFAAQNNTTQHYANIYQYP